MKDNWIKQLSESYILMNEGFFRDTIQKGKNYIGGRGFITDVEKSNNDLLDAISHPNENEALRLTKEKLNPKIVSHIDAAIHYSPHESVRNFGKKHFDPFNIQHIVMGIGSTDIKLQNMARNSPIFNVKNPLIAKALEYEDFLDNIA